MLSLLLVLAVWGAPSGGMRGPHHPRGHYHHQPLPETKLIQDSQLIRDVEHIKEDLGDWGMSREALHKLTPEELDFHYFKLHDFDNNTKLDGLEILQAIQHTIHRDEHGEEGSEQEKEGSGGHASQNKPPKEDDFAYFVDLIDQVLAEDDQDHDGYLSYMEYVVGRQREQQIPESLKRSHSHV